MNIRDIIITKDKNINYCVPECCNSVIDFRENSENTEENLSKILSGTIWLDLLVGSLKNSRFYWLY